MATRTEIADERTQLHEDHNCPIYDSISLWKSRPHVFNRRLKGAVSSNYESISDKLTLDTFKVGCRELLSACNDSEQFNLQAFDENLVSSEVGRALNWLKRLYSVSDVSLSLRKLIPRQPKVYNVLLEAILKFTDDNVRDGWMFIPLGEIIDDQLIKEQDGANNCSLFTYVLLANYESGTDRLDLNFYEKFPDDPPKRHLLTANKSWLKGVLIEKLNGLCEKTLGDTDKGFMPQSLSLVSLERYNDWYIKLKYKYGEELVKKWPERTDPNKYVYEDIAIASYLLVLWEKEREVKSLKSKQSFIDLGCGNGLLVYLLTKEGHPGKGIDIRNRKIWECYDDSIILEETSLHPNLFTAPDYDWLIGNHSDELTPWIPFIAARSSYSCRYFVLPCCFHDFNGKFQRSGQKSAQYKTYLSFVEDVGVKCGFNVDKDTLRIPSTKRVCHIGKSRTYEEAEQHTIVTKLSSILENRNISLKLFANNDDQCQDEAKDSIDFAPRQSYEPVRNCTRIDESIKNSVMKTITDMLLDCKQQNAIKDVPQCFDDEFKTTKDVSWNEWNAGGVVTIGEVVDQLDPSMLNAMKCQCGGLKTLFRNHSHILKVVKGMVTLRDYRESESRVQLQGKRKRGSKKEEKNKICLKTKLCWFYMSHPHGCPLNDKQCKFAHGENEIQLLPNKEKRQKWD